jgi:hypothetical protein
VYLVTIWCASGVFKSPIVGAANCVHRFNVANNRQPSFASMGPPSACLPACLPACLLQPSSLRRLVKRVEAQRKLFESGAFDPTTQ